ncbi:hypothetical protein [Streptomyces sp. NRRL F-2747]|nr:hypothetical protein [Streptomyces sp. NRRL F-2747]
MPSIVGLLERRELTARRRVDDLREEVDRLQALPRGPALMHGSRRSHPID